MIAKVIWNMKKRFSGIIPVRLARLTCSRPNLARSPISGPEPENARL
jgi:hypothetical protein